MNNVSKSIRTRAFVYAYFPHLTPNALHIKETIGVYVSLGDDDTDPYGAPDRFTFFVFCGVRSPVLSVITF